MTSEQLPTHSAVEMQPMILSGVDGEPPHYVAVKVAATAADALAFAVAEGSINEPEGWSVERVRMRELDAVACQIRGVDHPWWVECTKRARRPLEFWKLSDD